MQRSQMDNAGILSGGIQVNQMPPEMLSMIFSFLKLPDLVQSVLPVCKQWNEIANAPRFWKHLQFGPRGTTGDVVQVFAKSTLVKSIEINRRNDIGQIVNEVYNKCSNRYNNIEEITLNMCCTLRKCCDSPNCRRNAVDVEVPYGSNMLDFCSSLKKLTLINIQSNNMIGTNLRSLTELAVFRCHHFSPSDLQLIAKNCTQLSHLTILHNVLHPFFESFESKPGWDDAYQDLLNKRGPLLQVLRMNARFVSDFTFQNLSMLTRLHALCLENAMHLSTDGISAISTLRYLDHLHIDNCPELYEDTVAQLFSPGHLGLLKTLTMTKCDRITDECVDIISSSCPRLRKIDFSDCWLITDEGLELMFTRCLKLRCLNLFNAIGVQGSSFQIIPQTTPNLRLLIIDEYCSEGKEKFLKDLVARLPRLHIKR